MKRNQLVLKLLNASTTKRKQGYNIQNIVCIMHVACDDVLHEFKQISFEKKIKQFELPIFRFSALKIILLIPNCNARNFRIQTLNIMCK